MSRFSRLRFLRRLGAIALTVAALSASRPCRAHEDPFSFRLSSGALASLRMNDNAKALFDRHIAILVKTDQPIDEATVSAASAPARIVGKVRTPKATVDVTLNAMIAKGALSVDMPLTQIDALLYDWEERFASPPGLNGLDASFKSLSFEEGLGFRYTVGLKSRFLYQLTFVIPYDGQRLGEPSMPLPQIRTFIRRAEKDRRGRVVFEQNTSGLPIFLTVEESTGGLKFLAHHPMNTVAWDASTGRWSYAFSGDFSALRKIPEVNRLASHPIMRAWLKDTSDVLRVTGSGDPKNGFTCVVFGLNSKRRVPMTVKRGKVTVEKGYVGGS